MIESFLWAEFVNCRRRNSQVSTCCAASVIAYLKLTMYENHPVHPNLDRLISD